MILCKCVSASSAKMFLTLLIVSLRPVDCYPEPVKLGVIKTDYYAWYASEYTCFPNGSGNSYDQ